MVALSQARHRVNVSESLFSLSRGRLIKVAHSGGREKGVHYREERRVRSGSRHDSEHGQSEMDT